MKYRESLSCQEVKHQYTSYIHRLLSHTPSKEDQQSVVVLFVQLAGLIAVSPTPVKDPQTNSNQRVVKLTTRGTERCITESHGACVCTLIPLAVS